MSDMKPTLHYEVDIKYIPIILEKDWGVKLDDDEKIVATKLFLWRYGDEEDTSTNEFTEWNLKTDTPFTKGSHDGKISFSLNRDDSIIMSALINIVTLFVKMKTYDKIGVCISIASLFANISKIRFLNDYERCVFLQIIQLTHNSSSIVFTREDIEYLYKSEIFNNDQCPYFNTFSCNLFHENVCMRKRQQKSLNEIIDSLLEKKIIYPEQLNANNLHIS